jgi:type IV pilus assembly protein PilF
VLVILAGCVTEQTSVFTTEATSEDALATRVQLARNYIGNQDWDNAKRNLKLAQEIDPHSPEVAEAFALVYQSTGEYELAEENFKRAISLRRDFSRARNNYAVFLYSQQRYEDAEKQLEVVIKDSLYEARPRAFINLGLVRVRLGNDDGAREAFSRALTMDRSNSLAMLELAHIEYRAQNYAASDRHLQSYKRFRRQQSPNALWLGIRLAHAMGDQDAEASATLALRNLYPDSAEFRAYQEAVQNGEL